jgi:hypothetical protein
MMSCIEIAPILIHHNKMYGSTSGDHAVLLEEQVQLQGKISNNIFNFIYEFCTKINLESGNWK